MSKILLLDQDTINKIAAGEVVERPVSVIKELVENSIDASATAISVEIEEGGLKSIRITDNGVGMKKDDVKQAFLRHATSKIRSATDLTSIMSLGFRGEALASIAAVSITECITKTSDELTGIHYKIEGGIEKGVFEIGCPNGTTFIIRELFYNVPARKKFLKSEQTESSAVTEFIQRIALSHPGISLKYSVNGKVKLHTSGNYSLLDCIYQVFGKEFAKSSREVSYVTSDLKITGYIGEPILSRGNRQYEIYYVNGRYIKSNFIQKGIEEGMKEAMMIHQFPFAVLFLEIPYDQVDVNVHPNKMHVRFLNEELIRENFRQAVIHAFKKGEPIAKVSFFEDEDRQVEQRLKSEALKLQKQAPEPFETSRFKSAVTQKQAIKTGLNHVSNQSENSTEVIHDATNKYDVVNSSILEEKKGEVVHENLKLDLFLDEQKVINHKILGQLFKTYWLVEYNKELYIIDQHAAHEKVLYEAWVKNIQTASVSSQMLLEPMIYDLSEGEFSLFKRVKNDLTQLGFEVDEFGGNTIAVKSVPYLLNAPLSDLDFIYFFDQVYSGEGSLKKEEHYLHKLASIACKASIKGNNVLSLLEYKSLINQLLTLEDPYHCPHGRPTMIRMSQYELDKKFRRIV